MYIADMGFPSTNRTLTEIADDFYYELMAKKLNEILVEQYLLLDDVKRIYATALKYAERNPSFFQSWDDLLNHTKDPGI